MTPGRAICVEFDVAESDVELAADRLWSAGATAVEERDGDGPGRRRLIAGVPVSAIGEALDTLDPAWSARVVEVDDAEWADVWRTYAQPVRAGERLVIMPAWLDAAASADEGDAVVIRLDPGRSFGSGTHATTRMALAALEAVVAPRASRVLDVGSGSGVLAVAAARLGAARVLAVDIDEEAVQVTAENAARNGVAGVVEARLGELAETVTEEDGEAFDVVVVNIGAAAIIDAAGRLQARLAPGGHLVLTGFLAPAAPRVRAAFAALEVVDEAADGEWTLVTLRSRAQ